MTAIPAGIVSAVKRGTVIDRLAMVGAVAGQAVPIFWLALLLIAFFGVQLRWLPVFGHGTLAHLVLPAVSLSTIVLGRLARLVRSSMLEVLGQDYVRTARAKGLGEGRVLALHALRNAAIPIVTLLGLQFAPLLGGAVVTETVFAWPGVGRWWWRRSSTATTGWCRAWCSSSRSSSWSSTCWSTSPTRLDPRGGPALVKGAGRWRLAALSRAFVVAAVFGPLLAPYAADGRTSGPAQAAGRSRARHRRERLRRPVAGCSRRPRGAADRRDRGCRLVSIGLLVGVVAGYFGRRSTT